MINRRIAGAILLLFITSAALRAVVTDDTEPGMGGHYAWYWLVWLCAVVETVILWCVAG